MNQPLKIYVFHSHEDPDDSDYIQLIAAEFESQAKTMARWGRFYELTGAEYCGPKGIIFDHGKTRLTPWGGFDDKG